MKYIAFAAVLLVASLAVAGSPPPAGWNKAKPAPAANGAGIINFKHGDRAQQLPLNQIEIKRLAPTVAMVSLIFIDPTPDVTQRDKFELHFAFDGQPGKVRESMITGLYAATKVGVSKASSGKSKCDLIVNSFTDSAISGTLSCTGLTDMSAQKPAPDLAEVKFEAKMD